MINPFISIYSTHDLNSKVGELKQSWENFITNQTVLTDLSLSVRSDILNSWNRCQSIGLNPEQKQAKTALNPLELEHLLTESELYHVAKPVIDNIFDKLIGTGYLITLNDENGKMIYLKGESEIIRKTEKMNFSAGMDWSESAAGTNAIGTSIVSKKPIQVFSAEHFCEGFHPMTCSSAPIFQPFTKKVIGAIDFTGLWPSVQPHTLSLAVSLAQIIENQLLNVYREKFAFLEEYYLQSKIRWKNSPILVLNTDLILINGNKELMEALNLRKMMNLESHSYLKSLFSKLNLENNNTDLFIEAEIHGYQVKEYKPIYFKKEIAGYVVIFKEKVFQSTNTSSLNDPFVKHKIIGESVKIKHILQKCQQVASINAPILLTGETGTGKELIARFIHQESDRNNMPFIALNCGAIQKELIGSELFGYEGGTFTGGKKEGNRGKFEEANGGTLFLDEIGEMPLDLQVHLLRVLQENEITRLGSSKTIPINVKIIAATNKNLRTMIEDGLFRKDLFFRLNVISFKIPSLHERKEDILPLSHYYLAKFKQKYKKITPFHLTKKTEEFFINYSWPGNIRELRNALEHAVIFSNSSEIDQSHLPEYLAKIKSQHFLTEHKEEFYSLMEKVEMDQIKKLLQKTDWNISAVSKEMNIARSTLYRKLKKYNLNEKNRLSV